MTVRWKPFLIFSGCSVVVALVGLICIATVTGSGKIDKILARARLEVKAKEYEKAKLDYQRALKIDSRDASIHEEMANLYEEWSRVASPEKKAELRGLFLASLTSATKNNGSKRVEPRRRMLAEAIRQDDAIEQARWSKDLATLDPTNRDAHYVLAATELDAPSPNIPEVRRHLKVLDTETPRRARTDLIAAQIASIENDKPRLEEILKRARELTLPIDADPIDRMALLRLDALDVPPGRPDRGRRPRGSRGVRRSRDPDHPHRQDQPPDRGSPAHPDPAWSGVAERPRLAQGSYREARSGRGRDLREVAGSQGRG
jgi:tetratricopeptide (TPR) repeat protein